MKVRSRLLVPEIVQTSNMDCGPAALKCLLEGFGVSASYGRLREACQTDVDGTSIDTLEETAGQMGLEVEQIVVPLEHVLLPEAACLPALAVVLLANGVTHFVVAWRSHALRLVQLMDPAVGRRFVPAKRFLDSLYQHRISVPEGDWNDYAHSDRFQIPLQARLRLLQIEPKSCFGQDPSKLDAAIRATTALVHAGAVKRGAQAQTVLQSLLDVPDRIPDQYWSVRPAADGQLSLTGAVLVRALGKCKAGNPASPELASAMLEESPSPGRHLLNLLAADGWLSPVSLAMALLVAAAGVLLEAALFQGLLGGTLAVWRVAAFSAILLLLEWPVTAELLRAGRRLEIRLRVAFLTKLPRLPDRYLQSRLRSDMAERSHSLHLIRHLPEVGGQLLHSSFELLFTAAAIAWIDPPSAAYAAASALLALLLPLLAQPLLTERNLRLRTHSGALSHFYLDALLGLFAIHSHRAQPAVRRQQEALLSTWARAGFTLQQFAVLLESAQLIAGFGLAALLLFHHVNRNTQTGALLLLVYWALNLPVLGQEITSIAWQYPAFRNITLRMLEPLGAVERPGAPPLKSPVGAAVSLRFENVSVKAAGQTILRAINLDVSAGEHVAVIGPSGAGKSCLVGLLLGWYRPAEGRILVDGEPLDAESFRRAIAWLDPGVQIWNRTLDENIRYGENGADVAEAIDAARLQTIAERLDLPLGEGGGLVSGGEGQRVRFARAYVHSGVRLAILDEPFRGLDRDNRRALLAQSRRRWSKTTVLCITHDVSETLEFDRVVVLDQGTICEQGRPADLAADPDSRLNALLTAERQARQMLWSNGFWRRLLVSSGRVSEQLP